MGAWYFVNSRYTRMLGRELTCVARQESASPATGSKAAHVIEHDRLMERALS